MALSVSEVEQCPPFQEIHHHNPPFFQSLSSPIDPIVFYIVITLLGWTLYNEFFFCKQHLCCSECTYIRKELCVYGIGTHMVHFAELFSDFFCSENKSLYEL